MKITGDLVLVKKINKSIVLESIILHTSLSRARISQLTGLTKATVSNLVNELISSSLVKEMGAGQSSGGRKPVMLAFNNHAGYAIGVDLGVNYILTVLSDLQGNIVAEQKITVDDPSVESVITNLKACIHTMMTRTPHSPYGIIGIGIGVPGIIDDTGTILFAPNLRWEQLQLKQIIEDEFQVAVTIDNEANAGAVGEKMFGIGQAAMNLIYVSVGIGIGTGIMIRGELYRGSLGFSGEMGHLSIEVEGKRCSCGNRGCWELYASENALLEQANLLHLGNEPLDIETLVGLADDGHTEVIHLFTQMGAYLGVGITNIINTFNPELIIIGNRLTVAEKWLTTSLHQTIKDRSLPYSQHQLKIQFSTLGTYSAVLGASYFAISNFLSTIKVSVE